MCNPVRKGEARFRESARAAPLPVSVAHKHFGDGLFDERLIGYRPFRWPSLLLRRSHIREADGDEPGGRLQIGEGNRLEILRVQIIAQIHIGPEFPFFVFIGKFR